MTSAGQEKASAFLSFNSTFEPINSTVLLVGSMTYSGVKEDRLHQNLLLQMTLPRAT